MIAIHIVVYSNESEIVSGENDIGILPHGQAMTTDMFICLVRKYTCARKLTPQMLNELVEKIEVYNAEKIDGVWEPRLPTHYNCVGEITIPTMRSLPIPDVTVNTRKGGIRQRQPSRNRRMKQQKKTSVLTAYQML